MSTAAPGKESFRDTIVTVDKQGKRVWMYPAKPRGPLHRSRIIVAIILLLFMFAAPFIKIKGHPFLLFNFLERKFVLFGQIFWPQDFYLFVLASIIFVVFIVLFTVVFGRLWCGWACPQTIFMEMVFRKIEYWLEGNSGKQRALDRSPMDERKFFKKTAKHVLFVVVSFLIGNIALAYFVGFEKTEQLIRDGPGAHLSTFFAVVVFSLVTYGVFARFREQVCLIVCPYGRLQSVLLDNNSIVVAYNTKRGEPRQKLTPNSPRGNYGDCIECFQCVTVCPTGIDIRNGTQLECINCTACIDACNHVMERVGFPKGLIRYGSHKGVSEGSKLRVTSRTVGYSSVLVALLVLFSYLLFSRSDLQATILRTPGVMFEEKPDGTVRNLYSFKAINKTFDPVPVTLKLASHEGVISLVGGELILPGQGVTETAFFVNIPKAQLRSSSELLTIDVYGNGKIMSEIETKFLGPRVGESNAIK